MIGVYAAVVAENWACSPYELNQEGHRKKNDRQSSLENKLSTDSIIKSNRYDCAVSRGFEVINQTELHKQTSDGYILD